MVNVVVRVVWLLGVVCLSMNVVLCVMVCVMCLIGECVIVKCMFCVVSGV